MRVSVHSFRRLCPHIERCILQRAQEPPSGVDTAVLLLNKRRRLTTVTAGYAEPILNFDCYPIALMYPLYIIRHRVVQLICRI